MKQAPTRSISKIFNFVQIVILMLLKSYFEIASFRHAIPYEHKTQLLENPISQSPVSLPLPG